MSQRLMEKVRPWVTVTICRDINLADGRRFASSGDLIQVRHLHTDSFGTELEARPVGRLGDIAHLGPGDVTVRGVEL